MTKTGGGGGVRSRVIVDGRTKVFLYAVDTVLCMENTMVSYL